MFVIIYLSKIPCVFYSKVLKQKEKEKMMRFVFFPFFFFFVWLFVFCLNHRFQLPVCLELQNRFNLLFA